jgi:CheY-like chemotaxis protein
MKLTDTQVEVAAVHDIRPPGMDGYEATRRLRDRPWGLGITLVALTASGQVSDERRFREAGFDRHLGKPVDTHALGIPPGRTPQSRIQASMGSASRYLLI